jgi:hypothetical protein
LFIIENQPSFDEKRLKISVLLYSLDNPVAIVPPIPGNITGICIFFDAVSGFALFSTKKGGQFGPVCLVNSSGFYNYEVNQNLYSMSNFTFLGT